MMHKIPKNKITYNLIKVYNKNKKIKLFQVIKKIKLHYLWIIYALGTEVAFPHQLIPLRY